MVALIKGRNTPRREGDFKEEALAVARVFTGGILMRNAAGYITTGATAAGATGVGVVHGDVDNTGGAAGDKRVRYRTGTFQFDNSAAADAIAAADIGNRCFIVDDQTVAKTDGGGTRSPAGIIDDVDARGVWVRFDEALTKAAA